MCPVSLSKIKLEPHGVQVLQCVWLAQEFALHILKTWLKSELLAEITSIWAFNWKAKKFKFCLSRKLPVEAVAYLEKSKRIGDSLNGIVWFLFGCPGWNLIVLHMKTVISSCRITFRSLLRYNYLQRSFVRRRQRTKFIQFQSCDFCATVLPEMFLWLHIWRLKMEWPNAQSTELTSVLMFLAVWKVYLEAVVKG